MCCMTFCLNINVGVPAICWRKGLCCNAIFFLRFRFWANFKGIAYVVTLGRNLFGFFCPPAGGEKMKIDILRIFSVFLIKIERSRWDRAIPHLVYPFLLFVGANIGVNIFGFQNTQGKYSHNFQFFGELKMSCDYSPPPFFLGGGHVRSIILEHLH